jgi:3',5'-cyclic-AMP phosphodiesterase
MISRRELLGAGALALVTPSPLSRTIPLDFRFVHMTDLHMRDTAKAKEGIRMAVSRVLALDPRPDFVLLGGDVGDGLMGGDEAKARKTFADLAEELKRLEMPVHAVVGNHDVVGWGAPGAGLSDDPLFGKTLFADTFVKGPLVRGFDHKGWRILLLDSIQRAAPDSKTPYKSAIDEAQLQWLKQEVEGLGARPCVIVTHSPLLTGYFLYNDGPYVEPQFRMVLENAKEVHELLKGKNIKLVLQGHTHVAENLLYAGRQHITSGAVSGSWWAGPRFGIDPNGFSVLDVEGGAAKWAYVPTGMDLGG